MADAIRVSGPVSGTDKTLTFETGKLATQSMGAVVATIGGTTVFATANAARSVRDGIDFFPLTVDVEERAYAAGKIPGAFFRREGRPSEQAILTCRLTDRPLRPAFPDGYRNETQVVLTIMGVDMQNPHDVISINAASAAFMVSGIPFEGPIGAVRLAYSQDGKWIAHPTYQEGEDGTFEIVVAGRELDNGDVAIMMVEAGGSEKSFDFYANGAPKVNESVIADGLEASKTWIKESIALQRRLVASVIATNGPITPLEYTPVLDYTPEVFAAVERVATPKLSHAVTIALKADRNAATDAAADETVREVCGEGGQFHGQEKAVKEAVRSLTKKLVRKRVVEDGVRIDGRGPKDLRPVSSEVGILPTAHGTGLFQRGETQVLNVCTLAMPRMNQMLDTLGPDSEKRYIHHYNMAPWANGETGRVGSPKRREIGHGALAERALLPVVPSQEEFAYAIRLVSEVMSSNGSTSMASVCSSSLSLMDAGVPIKAPVAGIAMGLIYAEGKYLTLTDILGAEDAFGDMDFKVAGTSDAVTALQLDTKIDGIPADVLGAALQQAREARMAILDNMNTALSAPRPEVAATAPKIVSFTIPLDKVGEVIGPKGKVINTIQQETGADIAVSDDGAVGIVTIGSPDNAKVEEARSRILAIVDPPTAELGAVYNGRVVSITKFGAFVNILPGRDGLVHISKLGKGQRVNNVEDVLELGQEIEVRVDDIDDKGKVSLTPVGEGYENVEHTGERRERSDRGDRGGRDRDRGGRDRDRGPRDRDDRGSRDRDDRGERRERGSSDGIVEVSFEDDFDNEIAGELGDLGPGGRAGGDDRGDRGGRDRDRNRRRR
ncbi:MAG: polyribonucleotide nucleotidyltransferase [Acidimicrobiales bacterium]